MIAYLTIEAGTVGASTAAYPGWDARCPCARRLFRWNRGGAAVDVLLDALARLTANMAGPGRTEAREARGSLRVDTPFALYLYCTDASLTKYCAKSSLMTWCAREALHRSWGRRLAVYVFQPPFAFEPLQVNALARRAAAAPHVGVPLQQEFPHPDLSQYLELTYWQLVAVLRRQLRLAKHAALAPHPQDNSTFRLFFPTQKELFTYATTNHLSWALGQLVSSQHPLRELLCRTHRASSPTCPVCSTEDETVEHFLFRCPGFAVHRARFRQSWRAGVSPHLPDSAFELLSSHTSTAAALRALDNYLITTKRFFSPRWRSTS